MKSLFIFKLFIILFIVSLATTTTYATQQSKINGIINNNFKRMIDRRAINAAGLESINYIKSSFDVIDDGESKTIALEDGSIDEEGFQVRNGHQHLPGYKCIHDEISERLGINKLKVSDEEIQEIKERNQRRLLELESNAETTRLPLRFHFDTSYLYNKKDIAGCYSIGQRVLIGGSYYKSYSNVPNCRPDGSQSSPCYYTCSSGDLLSDSVADLIENDILTTIQDLLGSMVLVDRISSNLVLTQNNALKTLSCDYDYPIANNYWTTGVPNADMVVFVTARPIQSQSTIAYSAPCIFRAGSRPEAATINFNPRYFLPFVSNNKPSNFIFNEYIRVGIHEMTHGLGFTSAFFGYFKDRTNSNQNYPASMKVGSNRTTSGTTPNGITWIYERPAISTPTVQAFVRDHYNCYSNTTNFQLLEDYGAAGTAGSHWEKRTVGEEYMLGFVSPIFPITNLTLSLLADSSWFDVDKSLAEPLMWGKGLGCEWFDDCNSKSWNLPGYFCDDPDKILCSPTRVGKGKCNVQTGWNSLTLSYQHFNIENKAGDLIADGCPFYDVKTTYCLDASNSGIANKAISESFGDDSRCFEFTDTSTSHQDLACWSTRCVDQVLEVLVNQVWVSCDTDSKTYTIGKLKFVCPLYYYPCQSDYFKAPPNSSIDYPLFPGLNDINSTSKLSTNIYLLILSLLITIISFIY